MKKWDGRDSADSDVLQSMGVQHRKGKGKRWGEAGVYGYEGGGFPG